MEYQPVRQDKFFRRSRNRKLLCLLLLLVVMICIGIAIFMKFFWKKGEESCRTADCLAASRIRSNMNPKIDPCDDFYEFACGGFIQNTEIPSSKTVVDSFSTQSKVIDQQILSTLEEPINPQDTRINQLVKKLYRSCMNETGIEIDSMDTIKKHLRRLGGWPVVEGSKWNAVSFNWIETLLNLRETGMVYSMFMDFSVEPDNKNSSRRVLTIDQPYIPFEVDKRGPRNNPILNATHKFMVEVAEEFGAVRTLAEKEMNELLNFEMQLVKIMVPPEERRDLEEEYHPISIRELEAKYPMLPWYYFVNRLVAPSRMAYEDEVILYLPEYLEKLQSLIAGSSKRLIANYIFYKAAGSMITYSNKRLKEIQLEFTKTTLGVRQSRPRHEQCTTVASRLDIAVGGLYIRKYFDKNARDNTQEIVRNIEKQFIYTLKNLEWMDNDTKNAALDKLHMMGKYIGYPDELMDDDKLEEYYKDLQINSDNYIEVLLNVSKFQTEEDMKLLSEPVNKSDWRTRSSVAVVNAFYDLNANSIQVPAGILQGVFFGANRSLYLNYGGIGYIIGHEFTHGFDDEGSQMDKNGNLKSWWRKHTKDAYNKKAQCIVEQYSKILVPEANITINGINTQGENIADNGGIKLAYLAYQEWVTKHGPESKLPYMDYTPNQMFWIGTANAWCSKMNPKAMKQELMSGVHPPDKYRINIPFANSVFFAEDFNCKRGSNMRPEHICTVW